MGEKLKSKKGHQFTGRESRTGSFSFPELVEVKIRAFLERKKQSAPVKPLEYSTPVGSGEQGSDGMSCW